MLRSWHTRGVLVRPPAHVVVLYKASPCGRAAIQEAAQLAAAAGARLTVVVAAVAEPEGTRCCDTRSVYWNGVVRELAAHELGDARDMLGANTTADYRVVSDRSMTAAIAKEADRAGADLIVVPAQRGPFRWLRQREGRRVQRRTRCVVHVAAGDHARPSARRAA